MRVLIVGSGTKEYTLAKAFKELSNVDIVFVAPGNENIKEIANCVDIAPGNIAEILEFAQANEISLTVTFNEDAISGGIADEFNKADLMIFAPTKDASRITTSKSVAKKFMYKTKIMTPKFAVLDKESAALDYVRNSKYPLIIKNDTHLDNLPPIVCQTVAQARREVELNFIAQNKKIIIEDFIQGLELSFYVITDGYNAIPIMAAVPYKYSLDDTGGALTSGMGAYAPAQDVDRETERKILQMIIYPALSELARNDNPYIGILGVDLIVTPEQKIYAIEFNSCINEPDLQCITELMDANPYDLMRAAIVGSLADDYNYINTKPGAAIAAVLSAPNYGKINLKNAIIEGLDALDDNINIVPGDIKKNEYLEYRTNGRRVLIASTHASTLANARKNLYENLELINYRDEKYLKNIGVLCVGD